MAYSFFNSLFSSHGDVRICPSPECVLHLEEVSTGDEETGPLSSLSYVDIATTIHCFAIKHDENFHVKKIFSHTKGFWSRNDYLLVNQEYDTTEFFVIELKSRNYRKAKVINQMRSGVAMVSYCIRLGLDIGKIHSLKKFNAYAIVLTNTVTRNLGTDLRANCQMAKFEKRCGRKCGVFCVNGHEISLADIRYHAIPLEFGLCKVNDFTHIPPYPGTNDVCTI